MSSKFLIASCLAVAVTAQLSMSNPVPYSGSGNVVPLSSDGSNFPCQDAKYDFDGGSNVYSQGSNQEIIFDGNGVNGGGSCQVSITTDLNPTQSSDWRVIKSIIGGCLATDHGGSPYTHNFQIPQQLPAGKYSLAWTWFNNIGDQRMYMKCAPITVLGSGGKSGYFDSLPKMFIANIDITHCSIPQGATAVFPDPGADVDKFITEKDKLSSGLNCLFGSISGEKGPSPALAGENGDPVQLVPVPTTTQAPAPANSSVAIQPPPPRNSTSDITPPTAFDAGTPCTDEGDWNCIERKAFQRCGAGVWSEVIVMPTGLECVAGRASELEIVVRE